MLQPQQDLVTLLEHDFPAFLILIALHRDLRLNEALFYLGQEFITSHKLFVHSCHLGCPVLVGNEGWGISAINHLERRTFEGCLVRRVVTKFCPWKQLQ
jgi:hypothetical protein